MGEIRIPTEIWDKIFTLLLNSKDSESVSQVSPYWKDILHSTRSAWLYGQALPLLFEYLRKDDILRCRLVCRRWCYSVDHFLNNNVHSRPSLKGNKKASTKYVDTDDPLNPLVMALWRKGLLVTDLREPTKAEKIITRAATHAGCPLVVRSVRIHESPAISRSITNRRFLEMLGHHLTSLIIEISDITEIEAFHRISKLLVHVVNLRKLEINLALNHSYTGIEDKMSDFFPQNSSIPQLESFSLEITGSCNGAIYGAISRLLPITNVQSLDLTGVSLLPHLRLPNLAELVIKLESDQELESLLLLKSPLRRLHLVLNREIDSTVLFQVLCHFKATLNSFGFKFPQHDREGVSSDELAQKRRDYMSHHILKRLSYISQVSLEGWQPPSLNYLCGLDKSLEYLHIDFTPIGNFYNRKQNEEILDLLEILQKLTISTTHRVYKSVVWKHFSRLKVLTVKLYRPVSISVEYRRDAYECHQSIKLN